MSTELACACVCVCVCSFSHTHTLIRTHVYVCKVTLALIIQGSEAKESVYEEFAETSVDVERAEGQGHHHVTARHHAGRP